MTTNNGNTPKYVLGIDIDDTLTGYTKEFVRRLSVLTGVPTEDLQLPTSYDMTVNGCPGIVSVQDYLDIHNQFVREGMFAEAIAFPGAADALSNLRDAGAYVKIITTRFCSPKSDDMALVVGETGKFLLNNGIEYDEFMVSSTKQDIFAHLNVDDSPSNIAKFRKMGRDAIVPNTTGYTEQAARENNFPLMSDWAEGEKMILEKMDEFKEFQSHLGIQDPLFNFAL